MTAPLQYGTQPAADPTAVMGRRTLAWIADLLLYGAVVLAGMASMGEYVQGVGDIDDACQAVEDRAAAEGRSIGTCLDFRELGFEISDSDERVYVLSGVDAGVQTALSLGWFALFVVLQGLTGGSPGKLLFGLRVVDQYGKRCGIGKSLGRTVMWFVDAAPWIVPLVGPITAFTSTGHRRVGDLAAGTYVVGSSSVGSPVMPGSSSPPPGQTAWGAPPPGWGSTPPTAPPTSPPPSGISAGSEGGRWSSPIAPPEPDLDIRDLDVPERGERADEPPPTVDEPDWARPPDTTAPAPPEWSAPTLPDVEDPADSWQPPTDAGVDPEPPPTPSPFVAPGAEPPEPTSPPPQAAPRHELPPPQWDPARNTYLQWDPNQQAWLQWDAGAERWKPIDT